MKTTPEQHSLFVCVLLCYTHDMNCQIVNMHTNWHASNSCCANALETAILVTFPQLEAHFIHYAYLFSVIRVMRIPYLHQFLCLHTNTHISVTETAAKRTFT